MFTKQIGITLKALTLIFILIFTSCEMKVDCPDFDRDLLEWFPYEDGISVLLTNSKENAVLELDINKVIVNHTKHYMRNEDCGTCDDYIEINESSDDLHATIFLNENTIDAEYYLVKGAGFSDYTFFDSYIFDNKEYSEVKVFEDNTSNISFKKLIIAKGFGIIGLVDSDNRTWVLKPKSVETKSSIEIKDTSCG